MAGLFLVLTPSAPGRELSREDLHPAPSSSLTKGEALAFAALWRQSNPSLRDYCEVGSSGSMTPVLDSRCILLLERATATDLRKNDISIYLHSAVMTACHRVIEVRPDGILFAGDNNRRSDGWVAPERIRWRVAAIFFTRREPAPADPATLPPSFIRNREPSVRMASVARSER